MPFEVGNQLAKDRTNPKPFRDALIRAIKSKGADDKALVRVAHSLLRQASKGNVPAIKELADRLDGKVPQGLIADEDGGPIVLQVVRYVVDQPPQVIDITPEAPATAETQEPQHVVNPPIEPSSSPENK
jgi:hypothetical protein